MKTPAIGFLLIGLAAEKILQAVQDALQSEANGKDERTILSRLTFNFGEACFVLSVAKRVAPEEKHGQSAMLRRGINLFFGRLSEEEDKKDQLLKEDWLRQKKQHLDDFLKVMRWTFHQAEIAQELRWFATHSLEMSRVETVESGKNCLPDSLNAIFSFALPWILAEEYLSRTFENGPLDAKLLTKIEVALETIFSSMEHDESLYLYEDAVNEAVQAISAMAKK